MKNGGREEQEQGGGQNTILEAVLFTTRLTTATVSVHQLLGDKKSLALLFGMELFFLLVSVVGSLHTVRCCLQGACLLELHGARLGCISQ